MKVIPETLEEAMDELSKADDIRKWVKLTEDDATATVHFSWGMWVRNNWGLWKQEGKLYEYFVNLGIDHADDMSGIIFTSLHRKLNSKELDIEGQVDYYLKYWDETYKDTIDVDFNTKGETK